MADTPDDNVQNGGAQNGGAQSSGTQSGDAQSGGAQNDSIKKTLGVALALCVVCSVVVSTAAVVLKPMQELNIAQDRKRNILAAAGLYQAGVDIDRQFEQVTAAVVDLRQGRFVAGTSSAGRLPTGTSSAGISPTGTSPTGRLPTGTSPIGALSANTFADDIAPSTNIDPQTYDAVAAARDPTRSEKLDAGRDIAKIGRRETHAVVYMVGDPRRPEVLILPVRGAGLWGQMYGFLALEADLATVVGLGFYEHKETPGLGGEIDNPRWRQLWRGKRAFFEGSVDESAAVALSVVKGVAARDGRDFIHQVDGLSGATLTSRGVHNLVQFWLGADGFGPFLARLKRGEA